ncbi:MAG: hypothetical protein HOC70_14245 [Gammaproteobacteria bacterium]|jgi:hypothetical protein|nr:hypothetical protein [Gammaproteobacteria bacterium]MBT4494399.1 hypothetical protein [Gammaproteobacteria bacterium]
MNKSNLLGSMILAAGASFAAPVFATDFDVTVTNLTRGSYFTPVLLAAHSVDTTVFSAGAAASTGLQEMAEGGSIATLSADLATAGATIVENPAAGLLGPAQSTTVAINTDDAVDNTQLTVVAMILPTNDGFIGLNSIDIPTQPGTYQFNVSAYDAGTEGNDEIRGGGAPNTPGFPAPGPIDTSSGMNGTGVPAVSEGFVHIHRGVLGDSDIAGGVSDIDSSVHRWLNPIARVTVTIK